MTNSEWHPKEDRDKIKIRGQKLLASKLPPPSVCTNCQIHIV